MSDETFINFGGVKLSQKAALSLAVLLFGGGNAATYGATWLGLADPSGAQAQMHNMTPAVKHIISVYEAQIEDLRARLDACSGGGMMFFEEYEDTPASGELPNTEDFESWAP